MAIVVHPLEHPRLRRQAGLAETLAAEQAPSGKACGHTCACHGGYVCERADGHPTPHLGHQPDGSLVQWTIGECLTDEQLAAAAAAAEEAATTARETATRALLDQVDPALLVQLLRDGGHL